MGIICTRIMCTCMGMALTEKTASCSCQWMPGCCQSADWNTSSCHIANAHALVTAHASDVYIWEQQGPRVQHGSEHGPHWTEKPSAYMCARMCVHVGRRGTHRLDNNLQYMCINRAARLSCAAWHSQIHQRVDVPNLRRYAPTQIISLYDPARVDHHQPPRTILEQGHS